MTTNKLPSIFELSPTEEGGPNARKGFTYQDHVAVMYLLELLLNSELKEVWYETHDDILLRWDDGGSDVPEFIQVKAVDHNQLWTRSLLCKRKSSRGRGSIGGDKQGKPSLLENSLMKDRGFEEPRFTVVTSDRPNDHLKVLTYPLGSPGRDAARADIQSLLEYARQKLGDLKSAAGRDLEYWFEHVRWRSYTDSSALRSTCLKSISTVAEKEGVALLAGQAETLMQELLRIAKDAGDSSWDPNPEKSIFRKNSFCSTWKQLLKTVQDGTTGSTANLERKMRAAQLEDSQVESARRLRRDYIEAYRRPTYLEMTDRKALSSVVQSELSELQNKLFASQLPDDGPAFLVTCTERLKQVNATRGEPSAERFAFMQGCMYDITNRCAHRFTKDPK